MENTEKIVALLKEQVVKETLSLSGIEQVQQILDANDKLTHRVKQYEIDAEASSKSLSSLISQRDSLQDEVEALKGELTELRVQEQKFYEQSIRYEYENKRGDELKEIVGMALRNPVITKSRFESGMVGVANSNGYIEQHPTSSSIDTTETTN